MKLVIGVVRPEEANEVLEALYRAEVRGFSMSRVQGHGGSSIGSRPTVARPEDGVGREGPFRDRGVG